MNLTLRKAAINQIMEIISTATETCADVDLRIGTDQVTILSCPAVVLQRIMALSADPAGPVKSYDVGVAKGGLYIRLT